LQIIAVPKTKAKNITAKGQKKPTVTVATAKKPQYAYQPFTKRQPIAKSRAYALTAA
jgi:hypothetical protein